MATAVLVLGGWLAVSIGGALTAPGTDSTSARLAEWGRVHGMGWLVNLLEQAQYSATKPKTGGSVAGGVPSHGPVVVTPPAHTRAARSTPVPAPIKPLAASTLPREGQWQNLFKVNGAVAARIAYLRPDATHTSYLVNVVWMDQKLLSFKQFQGYKVPGDPMVAPDQLKGADRTNVLATFNSGFQMFDARGGYWQNGTTVKPLRAGAASMVLTKDGHVQIEAWPGGTPSGDVAAVRQNLELLISNGRISPAVGSASTKAWGATIGNRNFVWRTGIGVRKDGSVVFVVGPAMNVQTLASVLKNAGSVNAMELDINPEWTNYLLYSHPSPGKVVPVRVGADSMPSLQRYLQPSSRDFVGVFGR